MNIQPSNSSKVSNIRGRKKKDENQFSGVEKIDITCTNPFEADQTSRSSPRLTRRKVHIEPTRSLSKESGQGEANYMQKTEASMRGKGKVSVEKAPVRSRLQFNKPRSVQAKGSEKAPTKGNEKEMAQESAKGKATAKGNGKEIAQDQAKKRLQLHLHTFQLMA